MGFWATLFGFGSERPYIISAATREAVEREWKNIDVLRKKGGPSQLRQALIAADKTLDNVLRDVAKGETMAERLKNSKTRFDVDFYQKIWSAHKTRNMLVHESGYEPSYYILEEAIDNLRLAIEKLGVSL
uniref:DUF4145 domain-containing protein n=1 Tax=candidate division WWE3 bacterium TaxID=2053526 RepID=A0A7C4TKM9_UNCKA